MSVLLPLLIGLGHPAVVQGVEATAPTHEKELEELSVQTGRSVTFLKLMPDLVQFLIANDIGPAMKREGQTIRIAKYGIPMLFVNGQWRSWNYIKKNLPLDKTGRMINYSYSHKGLVQLGGPSAPDDKGDLPPPPPREPVAHDRARLEKQWEERHAQYEAEHPIKRPADACENVADIYKYMTAIFLAEEPKTVFDSTTGREIFDPSDKDKVLVYLETMFNLPLGFSLSAAQLNYTAARTGVDKMIRDLMTEDEELSSLACYNQLFDVYQILLNGYHFAEVAYQLGWIENAYAGEPAVDTSQPASVPEAPIEFVRDQACTAIQTQLTDLKKSVPWHTEKLGSKGHPAASSDTAIAFVKTLAKVFGLKDDQGNILDGQPKVEEANVQIERGDRPIKWETVLGADGKVVREPVEWGPIEYDTTNIWKITEAPYTMKQLRTEYRKLQLRVHDDKTKNYPEECQQNANKIAIIINNLIQMAKDMGLKDAKLP